METDLTPPGPSRKTKQSFLVLHEDELQRAYVEWLKVVYSHPLVNLRPLPADQDLAALMAHAANLRRAEKRKGTHFDQVWIVINLADPSRLNDVLELAEHHRVALATVAPDFSTWLRLHWHPGEAAPVPLLRELSAAGCEAAFADRLEDAIERSRTQDGTTFHFLIDALAASISGYNAGTKVGH